MLTPEQREEMTEKVRLMLGPEKAELWWKTRNPQFGNITPWTMTLSATAEKRLYRFIMEAWEDWE